MYDNTAGILKCRGSGVQNTCRIFSSYHSGVENTCRIFMQYPSVVQNTCRIVISHLSEVRNTAVLSQLRRVPGCRGATAYASQTAPRGRMTVVLWEVLLNGGWGYERVFQTGYIFRLGIRPCFLNGVYIPVGDTDMFSVPGAHYALKYGNVFRTGYALSIKIRTCFPNPVHVIHRNTNVFSEPGTRYPSKYGRVFRIRRRRRRARGWRGG